MGESLLRTAHQQLLSFGRGAHKRPGSYKIEQNYIGDNGHKDEYIERMRAVSAAGDWTGWVEFFLRALHEQACVNIRTADATVELYTNMRERFREELNSQFHDQALDFVFASPVFRNDRFVERSGIPASSARALSRRLVEAGILRTIEPASGRRAATYAFDPLLNLLKV